MESMLKIFREMEDRGSRKIILDMESRVQGMEIGTSVSQPSTILGTKLS